MYPDTNSRGCPLVDDVGGDLTERRHALGTSQRFAQREQLALAGCQLRIAD